MMRASNLSGLAALDITGISTGNCLAEVDGYTNAGDNGGGQFDWNSTSTLSPENVFIVRPNSISGSNPGRWIRRLEGGIITPEMGGCVGDYNFITDTGTDNTAAFNNIFNSLSFSAQIYQGAVLQIPAKRYLCTGTVYVTSGITIRGAGYHYSRNTFESTT
jgi:hypothetical protein